MNLENEQIPASYSLYLEQFEKDPEKTLQRLEKNLNKRGTDAVGCFFLAWLHHRHGNRQEATQFAWKAKILAPGSPFMDKLHYFLSHPNHFGAWEPEPIQPVRLRSIHSSDEEESTVPISDLDALIEKLSDAESKKIKLSADDKSEQDDLSKLSTQVDDIVTETLALIHEKQNNYSAAIDTYKKLRSIHADRREHYDEQIIRLTELLSGQNNGQDD
ncbi:MAG: hypothetical protein ACNA78_04145 [Balneolaceae bacterium]